MARRLLTSMTLPKPLSYLKEKLLMARRAKAAQARAVVDVPQHLYDEACKQRDEAFTRARAAEFDLDKSERDYADLVDVLAATESEFAATVAELEEFAGYLKEVHLLFGRCNYADIPERVLELVKRRGELERLATLNEFWRGASGVSMATPPTKEQIIEWVEAAVEKGKP